MALKDLTTRDLGKYFECLFTTQIIRLGFEVYAPAVDKGIDFILRKETNNFVKYFEVQVKAVRTKESRGILTGRLTIPRANFKEHINNRYLAFYHVFPDEQVDSYLIPAQFVCQLFRQDIQNRKEIWRLNLSESSFEKIKQFKDAFIFS